MQGEGVKKRVEEAVRRRIRGGRMLLSGKNPREVADAVGVSRQTAYSWRAIVEQQGLDAAAPAQPRRTSGRLER